MPKLKVIHIIIAFITLPILGQEATTVVSEDFAIRDFEITKDSIFYIKKRSANLYAKSDGSKLDYFIGGYGLKIKAQQGSNTIITASNELVDTVSSVRFYNKKINDFDDVYYYRKAKIIDFLLIPEASLFVLGLTNNKIVFIDYEERPYFYKTIELDLPSLPRKLIQIENLLYFATDNGEIYKYNYHNYEKTLLYKTDQIITELVILEDQLVYTTIEGEIAHYDLKTQALKELKIDNNFVSAMLFHDSKLFCGSWNGLIYVIDMDSFQFEKELRFHKRAILNIKKDTNNTIYSSSLDRTIKTWNLKTN